MNYIVLEHLSGPRARDVEEFSLSEYNELVVGRDLSANVRFAPDETLVGRQHLKLGPDPNDPTRFLITDLNSRNGTFINGHRVIGTTVLRPGDIVQCGPKGPEFRFDLRPATEPLASDSPPPTTLGGLAPGAIIDPTAAGYPLAHLTPDQIPQPVRVEQPRQNQQRNPIPAAAPAPPAPQAGPEPPPVQVYAQKAPRSNAPWIIVAALVVVSVLGAAAYIAYKSLSGGSNSEVATNANAPSGAGGAADAGGKVKGPKGAATEAAAGDAEKDSERTVWQVNVLPFKTLGGGRPGKGVSDFDKPDGLAFSGKGLLYATDAGNHRVQIWDPKTGNHLGEFGHGIFGGEIVDIAVAPNETVYVTDQILNEAYVFEPPMPGELDEKGRPLGPYDYKFKGTRFGNSGFQKLGGIAIDSRGRIYLVDAHANNVRRFNQDNSADSTFKFEQKKPDGDTYLHGCEGIAIDESSGNLFIASEKDSAVVVFDVETGKYREKLVGAGIDGTQKPVGKKVFFGSVEGLTMARRHLMAVDEGAGHIQLFNLDNTETFNRDLAHYGTPRSNRPTAYRGYFGHGPLVNFEDKTNLELQKQVKTGAILPGQANPPGNFCSPDAIASYDDPSGETYIAIADQCNYRIAVYRWSDISKALGHPIVVAESKGPEQSAPVTAPATPKAAPAAAAPADMATAASPRTESPRPAPRVTTRAAPRVIAVRRRPRVTVYTIPAKQKKDAPSAADEKKSKKKKKQ